jgi:hypothetical protein
MTDSIEFAEQFLGKLSKLPIQYDRTYNSNTSKPSHSNMKKPTVSIIEVTLKRLHGQLTTTTVKLSRTESSLVKLRREASSTLGCEESAVILVQDGQVLGDADVSLVCKNPKMPVYIFDRREWEEIDAKLGDEFRDEFVELLKKYGQTNPERISDKFLSEYTKWTE